MSKIKITGKELRKLGYPEGPVIPLAMEVVKSHFKHGILEEVNAKLLVVLENPEAFLEDAVWQKVAQKLAPPKVDIDQYAMRERAIDFEIFGAEHIEAGAINQMFVAAKLPIAKYGAMMADAHHGYGLPIGGVLATENTVIPYGVGVDIGCRMCLSIFDIKPEALATKDLMFENELLSATLFGSGAEFKLPSDHWVMDEVAFRSSKLLKSLHGKAWKQLGSSGSGNHFVEFGVVEVAEEDPVLGVPAGKYVGLLSHSGSRGLGANVAQHYTKLAKQLRKLPGEAQNLAWLSLDEEAGMEYWIAMNLAGDYASACHEVIHEKVAKSLGELPLRRVENHHNFAWKEIIHGQEMIVHRKGATPAKKDELGVIPGSMTANGYIVKGRGNMASLQSASHGAGRQMSRTKAVNSITEKMLREVLKDHRVKLIGGGLDEAPFAYKNIDLIMDAQQDLVDVVGKFTPKIVRMAGPEKFGRGIE